MPSLIPLTEGATEIAKRMIDKERKREKRRRKTKRHSHNHPHELTSNDPVRARSHAAAFYASLEG